MSANDFGVTTEGVRAHHFPNADTWSTASRPSSTAVTEAIAEEAGLMAGKLALELITASSITGSSSAYYHCRKVLRMQVAARISRDMLGADSAVALAWDKAVAQFYVDLANGGASFLGDGAVATGTSDPDGPTTHISKYGLPIDQAEDMSDTVPMCRKSDRL